MGFKNICEFWLSEGFLESGFYLVCGHLCVFLKCDWLGLPPRCCCFFQSLIALCVTHLAGHKFLCGVGTSFLSKTFFFSP